MDDNPALYTADRIWQAYEKALRTSNDSELAIALGITDGKLREWKLHEPAFANAIKAARESGGHKAGSKLSKYLSSQLPDDLRQLWEELNQEDLSGKQVAKLNLATRGDFEKQRLLAHALAVTNYDISKCCNLLEISKHQMEVWIESDPRFGRLLDEIGFRKKNFIESALHKKVAAGDTRAIIFANSTLNKDRGFAPTQNVNVNHNHNHTATIDLTKLNLPPDVKIQVLQAIKEAGLLDLDGLLDENTVDGQALPLGDPGLYPNTTPMPSSLLGLEQ